MVACNNLSQNDWLITLEGRGKELGADGKGVGYRASRFQMAGSHGAQE